MFAPGFNEERVITGIYGCGMLFLSGCNMHCVFCQNYEINIEGKGEDCSTDDLAGMMLDMQERGAQCINWVTPTHQANFLIEAWKTAKEKGLNVPIVYNCGGYEPLPILRKLEGVVDIYLPDFKFWDEESAYKYCGVKNYPETAIEAIKEMHRQVGDLVLDDQGWATRGLIVRHLVMPEDLGNCSEIFRWIAEEVSPDTFTTLLMQYHPFHRASEFPEINRHITEEEYRQALDSANRAGLSRIYQQ
ncbi:MAG: radical SAM protein [bacterium]